MTFEELPDVLTVEEFAKFARLGRRQAYAAVARGDVYSAKFGRSIRIPKPALRRWLEGDENENGQAPRPRLAVVGGADGSGSRPPRA